MLKKELIHVVICRDVMEFIEQIAPRALAEEWDNVGLLVGSKLGGVKTIMLCLDVTSATLQEAVEQKANLIITHHPVIFKGMKRLTEDDAKWSIINTLIKDGISVYAAHTNLDFAISGVNTQLAASLGLKDVESFGDGPGKTGYLENIMSLHDFIIQVKRGLNVPYVRAVGKADKGVQKAAVFCGSFDDNLQAVIESQADILVTGDLKYHSALDAAEAGLCIIDAGHFNTEKVVIPALAAALKSNFPGIEVLCSKQEEDPFKTC
jgi:dinuclear metal center YbgI/SA1388 family protein